MHCHISRYPTESSNSPRLYVTVRNVGDLYIPFDSSLPFLVSKFIMWSTWENIFSVQVLASQCPANCCCISQNEVLRDLRKVVVVDFVRDDQNVHIRRLPARQGWYWLSCSNQHIDYTICSSIWVPHGTLRIHTDLRIGVYPVSQLVKVPPQGPNSKRRKPMRSCAAKAHMSKWPVLTAVQRVLCTGLRIRGKAFR